MAWPEDQEVRTHWNYMARGWQKGSPLNGFGRGPPRPLKPDVSIFSSLGLDFVAWSIHPMPSFLFHILLLAFKETRLSSFWHRGIVSLMLCLLKLSITTPCFGIPALMRWLSLEDPDDQVTEFSHHFRYREAAFGEFGGHLLIARHLDWGCVTYK